MLLNIYRELNEKEQKEFRQWARENYVAGDVVEEIWHPIVRDECEKTNEKENEKALSYLRGVKKNVIN